MAQGERGKEEREGAVEKCCVNSVTSVNCLGLLDPVGVVSSGALEILELIRTRRRRGLALVLSLEL